LFVFYQMSCFS